uniref:Microtubule associated protein xmap215 n=1 Tax=Rhizophora mucronata TaxID=61149 RepID=A0A2P2MMX6_RHIMU
MSKSSGRNSSTFKRHVVLDLQNCNTNHLRRISKTSIISFLMEGSPFCNSSSPSTCFLKSVLRSLLCKSSLKYFIMSLSSSCIRSIRGSSNLNFRTTSLSLSSLFESFKFSKA